MVLAKPWIVGAAGKLSTAGQTLSACLWGRALTPLGVLFRLTSDERLPAVSKFGIIAGFAVGLPPFAGPWQTFGRSDRA